ncbi:MAG: YggT family protein [Acidaminobacter sp.]|nr:YggT family protein [Acidaminobacter sp.]
MTRQTITRNTSGNNQFSSRLAAILFGLIESLLAFRLIFKLLGANPENGFVSGIYSITKPVVSIFQSIFSSAVTEGLETTSVLEPGTLIAMIVVALIAWITFKLITPRKSSHVEKTEYSNVDHQNN